MVCLRPTILTLLQGDKMTNNEDTNNKAKAKIIEKYGTQWKFARVIGVDESYVSKVITGAKVLPDKRKEEWAKALGTTVDIFS